MDVRRLLLLLLLCAGALVGGAGAAGVLLRGDEVRDVAEAPGRAVERVRGPAVPMARCPREADGCRAVRGRVVFVESVDPDGDGDLHVVVTAGGITGPGVTSVDVPPRLRPARDPRIGDVVSAAGPVQRGSYGQAQLHALRFRTAR